MKINSVILFFGAILTLHAPQILLAQTDLALLRNLAEDNQKSVEALVLYPSETRTAILESTKYPEVLIKMQNMRDKTSAAFRTLIEDFPRTTQAVFYDLNRYPGLTESLTLQSNNPAALRKTLEVLPSDKQEEAFGVVHRQMPTLKQIHELNQTTRRAFERLIAGYPSSAQQAFEHLLGLPEVIDLLNEDLRFTILVGETYRDHPAWVIQKTDSLNLAVARSHAEELENWKSSLENDPAAKMELQSAAREYAAENGYDDDEPDDLYNDGQAYPRDEDMVIHHYYEPYPYWYGYPWWEPYPRWHPYPGWWDWGGYFYPHGMVIIYLPSYHFTHWYFNHPYHHEHYNHLSTHFVNHYYGHRHSGTTISMGVREWREGNRAVISDDFLADKNRLPERLKEYGRFEQSRREFNAKNPERSVSPEEFLNKNTRKYPEIERSRTTAINEIQREDAANREKRADWAPSKAPAKAEPVPAPKTERPPRQAPVQNPTPTPKREQPAQRAPVPAQRPRTQPSEARDYHRQNWEEKKTTPQTPRNTPAPAPAPKKERVPSNAPKGRGN